MTATEQWIFLCAAHKTPKECPAIGHSHLLSCMIKVYHTASSYPLSDYTRHTLDGAACLLNSNKYFPSRVSIKVTNLFNEHDVSHYFDDFDDCGPQLRRAVLQSLVLFVAESTASSHMHTFITGNFPACILSTQVTFSHAYFCHRWLSHTFFEVAIFALPRQIFDVFENESHLCRRFTVFVTKYNLMSKVCSKWTCKIISKYMPSKMWIFRTTWLCRCLSRKPVQGANLRPKIKTFQKCIILE